MKELQFFDCNMMVGRFNAPEIYQPVNLQEMLAVMRRCGIAGAMAASVVALEYHPLEGNLALSALCENTPVFKPVWVLLPGQTGEFPRGAALAEMLERHGVRMVRLCPSASRHNFSLAPWCSGEMLGVLQEKHIPVLLDAGELSWDALHELLSQNPRLRVVLTNATYRMDRVLYPLLAQHETLFLETSGLKGFLSVEDLCKSFGASRLLFGSGMPVNSAGAGVAIVEYADITWEEKQLIASGNLQAMLADVR